MSRNYRPGDTYYKSFPTSDGTGAAVNADSLPTAKVIRNGAVDGTVTPTVSNLSTGIYSVTYTIPVGYAAGDVVETEIDATISTLGAKGVIDGFRLVGWPNTIGTVGSLLIAGTGTAAINPTGGKVPATIASGDYAGNTPQTGDTFARLGAPTLSTIAADIQSRATAGAVWDEPLSATSHNGVTSAGRILRLINPNSDVIHTGTARAGSTSTTIVLDNGASTNDDAYDHDVLSLPSGTGAGQSRVITGYVGADRTATVDSPWTITPDITTNFEITPSARALVIGYEAGQDPATQVLDAVAASHTNTGTIGADIAAAAGGGGGTAPTAAEVATAILTDTTPSDLAVVGSLGHLIGTAPAWYTAPDNADVAAIKTQTDKFVFDVSNFVKSDPQTSITVGDVTLAASQPNFTPAKAGDAMTLTSAYDLTKTAAQPGDGMALSDAFLDTAATFRDQRTVTAPTNRDLLQGAYGIYTPLVKDDATGNFNVVSPLDNAVILYTYSADDALPATLISSGLDAIGAETGVNARQAISLILAACAGTLSGAGTDTIVINGCNGGPTRITATVDNFGNRSAVTLNIPA